MMLTQNLEAVSNNHVQGQKVSCNTLFLFLFIHIVIVQVTSEQQLAFRTAYNYNNISGGHEIKYFIFFFFELFLLLFFS